MRGLVTGVVAWVLLAVGPPFARADAVAQYWVDEGDTAPPQATPAPPDGPPSEVPPLAPPPAEPPQVGAGAAPAAPAGQWVYTQQYGWLWMPYSDAYTYIPPTGVGVPYTYAFYPAYGWAWVASPWVWGYGPWPYFGVYGAFSFGWYGHGYWHTPHYWTYRPVGAPVAYPPVRAPGRPVAPAGVAPVPGAPAPGAVRSPAAARAVPGTVMPRLGFGAVRSPTAAPFPGAAMPRLGPGAARAPSSAPGAAMPRAAPAVRSGGARR
jgi:hypothetical protein